MNIKYPSKKKFTQIKPFLLLLSVFFFLTIPKPVNAQVCEGNDPPCERFNDSCRNNQVCIKNEITGKCYCRRPGGGQPPTPPTPVEPPPPQPLPPPDTEPFPEPTVPCDEVERNEFHSLRPYQASPCNQNVNDVALFCGNDLVLLDTITIQKSFNSPPVPLSEEYTFEGNPIEPRPPGGPDFQLACTYCNQAGQCVRRDDGRACVPDPEVNCNDDPSECTPGDCIINANGTTETCYFNIDRVKNIAVDLEGAELPIMGYTEPSIGNQSDPYRVINSRLQDETVTDPQKVNEYVSWYINGLIQRAEYDPPNPEKESGQRKIIDFSGPLKKILSRQNQIIVRFAEGLSAGINRHNQIVACRAFGILQSCYPPIGRGQQEIRISQALLSGSQNPIFSYIPFSSTEDRKGQVKIDKYSIQPPSNAKILFSEITSQSPADLFFAHMQESYELADLLQKTFAYKGANLEAEAENAVVSHAPFCEIKEVRSGPGDQLFPGKLSATVSYTAQVRCEFLAPGDGRVCQAGGGQCYVGTQNNYYCQTYYPQVDCPTGQFCGVNCNQAVNCSPLGNICYDSASGEGVKCCPGTKCIIREEPLEGYCDEDPITIESFKYIQTCTTTVQVAFKTVTKTPLSEKIWNRLVAGPTSVFRRIFPQIKDDSGRPIRRLWDIPVATNVVFRALSPGVRVVAGNPASGRSGEQAQLYFPHVGGIHEYFLKCIQKTLRPKGYGEGCVTGPLPTQIENAGSGGSTGVCGVYDAGPNEGQIPVRGSACQPGVVGWCSIGTLTNEINGKRGLNWSASQIRIAAIVCNGESGGWTNAFNDGCLCNRTCDFSIGLFQINALPGRCDGNFDPDAFEAFPVAQCPAEGNWSCDYSSKSYCCIPKSDAAAQACINYWTDPDRNIDKMITLSRNGTDWDAWSYYSRCFE